VWGLFNRPSKISAMYSSPVDLWAGNPRHGSAILNGFFSVADETGGRYQKSWAAPQDLFDDDEYFSSYLCRFAWLRDLKATGDMSARRLARRLIEHWYEQKLYNKTKKKLKANEETVIAERLSNFILLYDFFGASADDSFKKIFFKNIQLEYRALKQKMFSTSAVNAKLKALIEFNIYCEYDPHFFQILLIELTKQTAMPWTQYDFVDVNDVYRNFCTMINVRNALIQWEKSFILQRNMGKQYQAVFQQIQENLQQFVQIIRFFRHSNGSLCRLTSTAKSVCFFEQILSSDIDTALSQVENSAVFNENKWSGILRLSNKYSVLFISIRKNNIKTASPNLVQNAMNFEWSYQSYDVICDSAVAIYPEGPDECDEGKIEKQGGRFPKLLSPFGNDASAVASNGSREGKGAQAFADSKGSAFGATERSITEIDDYLSEMTDDGPVFSGILTDNEESYAFRREMALCKDAIQGTDTFVVDDAISCALLVLNFAMSTDWSVIAINHEEQSLFGEIVMSRTVKRTKVSCVFKIEMEQLFSITAKPKENRLLITVMSTLSSGIPDNAIWSFQIVKAAVPGL
jgi:hypothetical protein